ncbi:PilC/PilY family type IV pilus protein [Chitinimonas viridis]|uniref:PilC/PilY family type IV pilus protein n=1 Tax=Chitinimonas viridis TaxID=664880 RepID=A0ABT8B2C1_9NEIS|nr:PilC/PilY family type IV pilus protein [Chitinimonas viridis]MDN3575791.1 PilC/PilY family type IV pilus protein [Chitinimonas viridis]
MSDSKSFATKTLVAMLALCQVVSVEAVVPPLGNTPLNQTSLVEPNLMFVYDTSGSMAWSHVPDHGSSLNGDSLANANVVPATVGYKNALCNSLAFNPALTYDPPTRADGTLFPNSTWTSAYYDGLRTSKASATNTPSMPFSGYGATIDLSSEYFAWDLEEAALSLTPFRRGNNNAGSAINSVGNGASLNVVRKAAAGDPSPKVVVSGAGPNYVVRVYPGSVSATHNYQLNDLVALLQPASIAGIYRVTNVVNLAAATSYFEFSLQTTAALPTVASGTNWHFREPETNGNNLGDSQLYVFGTGSPYTAYLVTNGIQARMLDGYRVIDIDTQGGYANYNGTYNLLDVNSVDGNNGFAKFQVTTNYLPGTAGTQDDDIGRFYQATELPSAAHYYAYTGTDPAPTDHTDVKCKEAPTVSIVDSKKVLGNSTNFTKVLIPLPTVDPIDTLYKTDGGAPITMTKAELNRRFANWFTYYRRRSMTMKSAVSTAFGSIDGDYRVGFMTIHAQPSHITTAGGSSFRPVGKFVGTTTGTVRGNWYSTLFAAPESGSTPLREALAGVGRYYGNKYSATVADPMYSNLNGGACQRNYTILSTDGMWNSNTPNPLNCSNCAVGLTATPSNDSNTVLDADSATGPATFAPFRLRSDGAFDGKNSSGTLADVALHYYGQDIRPDLPNNYGTANPANFQNMVSHTIGLGLSGRLKFIEDYKTSVDPASDFNRIKTGVATCSAAGGGTGASVCDWPDANTGNPNGTYPERVDDLWHAAVNGRGTFFSAKDPGSLARGLIKALTDIKADVFKAVAPSTASPVLSDDDNVAYVASYRNGSWSGRLEAKLINPETGEYLPGAPIWRAHQKLDAAVLSGGGTGWDTQRRIAVGTGSGTAVPFRWASLPAGHRTVLEDGKTAAYGESLLNYLRGDKSNEGESGNKLFRARGDDTVGDTTIGILGDIINSRPVVLSKATSRYSQDYHEGYDAFVTSVKNRPPVVYVNSNDGMLHAFDATSAGIGGAKVATATSGKELWAYIPSMLLRTGADALDEDGRKNGLQSYAYSEAANPPFRKHFLSDATPTIFDADLGHTGGTKGAVNWRSLLISGLNKGGKGYFALDVTNGAAATEVDVANKLLWEFKGDADMGYSFGSVTVSWIKDHGWVVIVPSGYNNSTGNGAIWILNAKTGAVVKKFTISSAGCGTNSCFQLPGLSASNPLNLGSLATFVTSRDEERLWSIYAADMQGNVWRMDVSDANMNNWKIVKLAELDRGLAPKGVYDNTRQPVTVNPAIAWDSAADARWIFIGTGLDQSKADRDGTFAQANQVQTMYAIRDGKALAPLTGSELPVKRDVMVPVNRATVDEVNLESHKRGWYMDLAPSEQVLGIDRLAERVVLQPSAALGQVIFASTIPTKDLCSPGNVARVYARSYLAGKEGRSFLKIGTGNVAYKELTTGAAASPRLIQLKGGKIVLQSADVKGELTNVGLENADVTLQTKASWRELIPD